MGQIANAPLRHTLNQILELLVCNTAAELSCTFVYVSNDVFVSSLVSTAGYGGPHAGFFAVKKELMKSLPGRIVGQTK